MSKPFLTPLAHGDLPFEPQLHCHNCNIPLCYAELDVIRTDPDKDFVTEDIVHTIPSELF